MCVSSQLACAHRCREEVALIGCWQQLHVQSGGSGSFNRRALFEPMAMSVIYCKRTRMHGWHARTPSAPADGSTSVGVCGFELSR